MRFLYRLGLALGVPDVGRLAEDLPWVTFLGWQKFAGLEPFGSAVEDARFGVLASVTANAAGGKKGGGTFQPSDFFDSLKERYREMGPSAWEAGKAAFKAKAAGLEAKG